VPFALKLRPATSADRDFVESVYFETQRWLIERLFGWRGDDAERAKFSELYSEAESEIISIDGRDVGWMSVRTIDGALDLDAIYIIPAAQNRGIGTLLVRRTIERAKEAGVALRVSTAKINPARRLYERLGFVEIHESEFKIFMELG
jgi:GNAT superfamily N-acetyltransferase